MYSIVSCFTKYRLFLRSGVTTVRYIHHHYADSWLIHSYKIHRLERESLIPVSKRNLYNVTEPKVIINEGNGVNTTKESNENCSSILKNESSIHYESLVELDPKLNVRNQKNVKVDKDTSSHSDEECNIQVKKRIQRKRTPLLPQKDISKAAKQLDLA